MLNLTLKTFLICVAIILAIVVTTKFLDFINFSQSEIVLEKDHVFKLQLRETLNQKFTSSRDGLSKIHLALKSIDIEEGDKVMMEIADESCNEILRRGLLLQTPYSSENLYEFIFDRIPDSAEKTYCLKATVLETKENVEPIIFFTTGTVHYEFKAQNQSTGKETTTHLSMRPGYTNESLLQNLSEINQRISQYKPWFLKQHSITALFLLTLITSFSLLVVIIRKI